MNLFRKNRIIFWLLAILVVINICGLASFFLYPRSQPEKTCCSPEDQQCNAFRNELNLSSEQTLQVAEINKKYKTVAEPISSAIKDIRAGLLTELEKSQPDTLYLNTLVSQLAVLQMKIQKENIKQFCALKEVCTTEQAHKLSALYRGLYGCPMKNN